MLFQNGFCPLNLRIASTIDCFSAPIFFVMDYTSDPLKILLNAADDALFVKALNSSFGRHVGLGYENCTHGHV